MTAFTLTLLCESVDIHSASSALSPEVIATQIALDERFCESVKDAIAESIRRQLTTFTSFIGADISVPESLHPIYLDLLIDGLAVSATTC